MPRTRKSVARIDHRQLPLHPVELAVVSPLVRGISFDYPILEECVNRGFIPSTLGEALTLAKFLSRTVLAAQAAQRMYGVPASFLIGVGLYDSGWSAECLCESVDPRSELPERDPHFAPESEQWFLDTARCIAKSAKYSKAMAFAHDIDAFAQELSRLGYRPRMDMEDILYPINTYDLQTCDLAALRHPNEYNKWAFTAYRDAEGMMQLRASWIDLSVQLASLGKVAALPD